MTRRGDLRDLRHRIRSERKTLQWLYTEQSRLERLSDARDDELLEAINSILVQTRRRIQEGLQAFETLLGVPPEPAPVPDRPVLPVPVIEDDLGGPATHWLDWEQDQRANACIYHGYQMIGKPRGRRYEGFDGGSDE